MVKTCIWRTLNLNLLLVWQDAARCFNKFVRFCQLHDFSDLFILLDLFFSELFDCSSRNDLLSRHTHNALLTGTVGKILGRRNKYFV